MVIYDYIFVFIVLIFSIGGLYFGVVKSFSKLFCLLIPLFISYIVGEVYVLIVGTKSLIKLEKQFGQQSPSCQSFI